MFIERTGNRPPRTHDLVLLAVRASVPVHLHSDCAFLVPLHTAARYPDEISMRAPVNIFTSDDAANALGATERIMNWTRQQFQP